MGNEFFVGLERLHRLTYENPHELIIKLDSARFNHTERCRHFNVGNQSSGYRTESMDWCYIHPDQHELDILLQGIKFSTFDRDVDDDPNRNWAKEKGFGWWWPSSTNFRI
ncbi:fibrinogen beta chain-like isoform X2 [Drosophila bipectinata]|uniref:fibrinogen beta chain-like isoform X2 n=1 Tax=Drosophila bipectinata TaxID=42026 RepID=UPI0038B3C964